MNALTAKVSRVAHFCIPMLLLALFWVGLSFGGGFIVWVLAGESYCWLACLGASCGCVYCFYFLSTNLQNVKLAFPSSPNLGKNLKYYLFIVNQKANNKYSARTTSYPLFYRLCSFLQNLSKSQNHRRS